MTKAEEFCKLNSIKWHEHQYDQNRDLCSCGLWGTLIELYKHFKESNPTFTDAKSILEVMITRKDWMEFVGCKLYNRWILFDYILNPDRLLDEAIKFCKEAGNGKTTD